MNQQFPKRMLSCRSAQNWPPQSLDMNTLYYHLWGCMKAVGYAHKVNTRGKIVRLILSTARHISNTAVLQKMMFAVHMGHADESHFQTVAQIVKYVSVTVHFNAQPQ